MDDVRDSVGERARSFGVVAAAYERARPGYPDDAIRWLVGDEPSFVVDLGAGTGKLTRQLVERGHRVIAVEPLREMLLHVRATSPAAVAVVGRAEALPLATAAADVVVCAQAFHWFDKATAVPEIARVLRASGRVAMVWNLRDDREPWVAQLSEVIGSETAGAEADYSPLVAEDGHFEPMERATFSFTQSLDRHALHDLVLSRSYCAVRSADERARVLAAVDRIFDAHARGATIALPYITACFRAGRGRS